MSQRILITSGPTREYLDPVRFLSNASSGRMGLALCKAVMDSGDEPVVVSGPVEIEYPENVSVHKVVSTTEMLEKAMKLLPECDGVIAAAAPCDFMPFQLVPHKLSKNELRGDGLIAGEARLFLELRETPDIIANLVRKKSGQWFVAFALETQDHRRNAIDKLHRKGCDLIILNDKAAIHSEENAVEIIAPDSDIIASFSDEKNELAKRIIAVIGRYFRAGRHR